MSWNFLHDEALRDGYCYSNVFQLTYDVIVLISNQKVMVP